MRKHYYVSVRYDHAQPIGSIRLPAIAMTDLPVTGRLEGSAMVYNGISYHAGVFATLRDALNAVKEFTGKRNLTAPQWPNEYGEWPVTEIRTRKVRS